MERIPVNRLDRISRIDNDEILSLMSEILESGIYTLGSRVAEFESNFAKYLGAKYSVGVANGTDALEIAITSLCLPQDSSIATAANAGGYATAAILASRANPVYVDIEEDIQNMSPDSLLELISKKKLSAVIFTHLFGNMKYVDKISEICLENGIPLIEDCAQAAGAALLGKNAGTWGTLATFSFYPTKPLAGIGDGGAITTDDITLRNRIRQLRMYGWGDRYRVETKFGRNSRLDEIQASVLNARLSYLEKRNEIRRSILREYAQAAESTSIKPCYTLGLDNAAHLAVFRTPQRENVIEHFKKLNIDSNVHYPTLDYKQNGWSGVWHSKLQTSELLNQQILTLPLFDEMNPKEIMRVLEGIQSYSRKSLHD